MSSPSSHWINQRISGLVIFISSIFLTYKLSFATFDKCFTGIIFSISFVAITIFGIFHGFLGISGIIQDYISSVKIKSILLSIFLIISIFIASIFFFASIKYLIIKNITFNKIHLLS